MSQKESAVEHSPEELEDVARRLRDHGFDDLADEYEDSAAKLREADR